MFFNQIGVAFRYKNYCLILAQLLNLAGHELHGGINALSEGYTYERTVNVRTSSCRPPCQLFPRVKI